MYITKKLWGIVKKNLREIIVVSWWTTASIVLNICRMLGWGILVWYLIEDREWNRIAFGIGIVILFTIIHRSSEHAAVHYKAVCGDDIKKKIRSELFEKLFYLGPQFIDKKHSGEIVTTLWEKIEWLNYYLLYYIPTTIAIAISSVLCAMLIWQKDNMVLSLVILLAGGLVLSTPIFFYQILKVRGEGEWEESDEFYSFCMEGLKGITTLKAFNANDIHRKKINEKAEEVRKSTMANLLLTTANSRLIEIFILSGEFLADIIGICGVINGSLQTDKLILLFFMMRAWSEGARHIFGAWLRGNKGIAGSESVLEILEEKCTYSLVDVNTKLPISKNVTEVGGDIIFENVTFSYAGDSNPAIENVNLKITNGTQTALIGSSGSGKSTIAHLLFGFYRPQKGTIKVNGEKICESNVKTIQSMMSVIWQDCHIFHMSCYDNIRIARMDATEEEVYSAAKKANIHDTILKLSEGYATVIGDGGRVFSGGEKQRIAIARAFLRNAPILILDEATSSLDRKNEADIQRCISDLSEGKTMLIIAHRLDTIRNVNQICVVEAGKIVEQGTHSELLEKGKRYLELMGIEEGGRDYASQK